MKHRICEGAALFPGKSVSFLAGDIRIAVFRSSEGNLFALEDRCPHRGARLSEGLMYEDFIACRDHGWSICLRDGHVQAPERGSVQTYPVLVEDDIIYVLTT